LTEKTGHRGTIYYENSVGEVFAKVCSKCKSARELECFAKKKAGLGGRESACKECRSENMKKWYEENKELALERSRKKYDENKERHLNYVRKWREANKERYEETRRNWRRNNPEKESLIIQRRLARKRALPDNLTEQNYVKTLFYFGYACALTGETENLEKEHAIPLSIGHGGTTFENCYPMANGLNQSKGNKNIFEWFEANRQRFNLSQERFDRLIEWLGKANGMTVEEYRDYVYWCHANPRNVDEDDEQQAI
jgi:hypothetical protein